MVHHVRDTVSVLLAFPNYVLVDCQSLHSHTRALTLRSRAITALAAIGLFSLLNCLAIESRRPESRLSVRAGTPKMAVTREDQGNGRPALRSSSATINHLIAGLTPIYELMPSRSQLPYHQ